MRLEFATKELKKICTDDRYAQRRVGTKVAKALGKRTSELRRALVAEDLLEYSGRWEPLKGNREGQWSGRLTPNWRLIVDVRKTAYGVVVIVELVDYH